MSDITKTIEIYTDGSSLGNPGPSGLGYIIRYWEVKEAGKSPVVSEVEGSQGFRLSTNNRMEIMAVIYGINFIIELLDVGMLKDINQIELLSDSQYFCDSIVKGWLNKWSSSGWVTSTQKPVKNKDLWESIITILNTLKQKQIKLNIYHIPGHQGVEFNEKADKLCTAASADTSNHIVDVNYESSMVKYKKY